MGIKDTLSAGFDSILNKAGKPVRVAYFTQTIGSVWDDEVTLVESGTIWTSGIVLPLSRDKGSTDAALLEQGKLIDSDLKLFVHGSLVIAGSEDAVRIRLGSPTGEEYTTIVPPGIAPEVQNQSIYRRVYIRRLTNGSLIGE